MQPPFTGSRHFENTETGTTEMPLLPPTSYVYVWNTGQRICCLNHWASAAVSVSRWHNNQSQSWLC